MLTLFNPNANVDFVSKLKPFGLLSALLMVGSLVLLFTKGLNFGVDFTGGAEMTVQLPQAWSISDLRTTAEEGGLKGAKIVQIGEPKDAQYLVRVQGDENNINAVSNQLEGALSKKLKSGEFQILKVDLVGPQAGSSLRMSGFLSMLYALICILIYVTVRFDWRYSPGAVIALFHDVLIVLGAFVITQRQFDLQVVAAILAIIGYSINDTIVIYDRVRERSQLDPTATIEAIVNRSVNETMSRTVLTSLTTFFTILAIYLFGGEVTKNFAFALMVGIFAGTYSTVFVASSFVVTMTYYLKRKKSHKNHSGKYSPARA
jgi:preprotein translocase subunit SecF